MSRDYREEFKENCLTCKKYDIYSKSDATVRGFRCKRLLRQVAMDGKCYQHDFDYLRGNSTIEEAVEWIIRRGYDPRPDCYVTTAICEILGLPYDHEYITSFKKLRDEYMATFAEGKKQIAAYDVYGVQIAMKLKAAYENAETKKATEESIKKVLVPGYLEVVKELVKSGNFAMAMYTYFQMIGVLSQRYGVSYSVETINETKEEESCLGRNMSYEGA